MLSSIHLTLLMGPLVPGPVPAEAIDALLGVQVTSAAGDRSGFQLSFAVSKDSLINRVLLPAGYFDPPTRVIIIATVNALPSVIMDGIITRQEFQPSDAPGQSTLTVTGQDVSVMMGLIEVPGIPFPAMTYEVQVGLILAKYLIYGVVPMIIPSPFQPLPNPLEQIQFQKGTDLAHVQELAKKIGYTFYIDPGPLPGMNLAYFGPEIRIGIPQPALNVNMDALSNVESLSFSFDGTSRTNLALFIQEPITKLNIPIPLPDISPLRPPLALKQAPALKFRPLKDTAKKSPQEAAGEALGAAAESSDAVTGTGTLDVLRYGQALKARGLVGVRGAGPSYDGLYYVKSVTHNIKRGEYKQSFNLARNGLISLTPVVPT
jgi:hypothetical protein